MTISLRLMNQMHKALDLSLLSPEEVQERLTLLFENLSVREICTCLERGKRLFCQQPNESLDFSSNWCNLLPSFRFNCTSHFALENDMGEILKTFFHEESYIPMFYDPILTALFEAWSNALLWSNLEISAQEIDPNDPFGMGSVLEKKINQPNLMNKRLQLSIYLSPLKVTCFIQHEGIPFFWDDKKASERPLSRGIGIIKAFSDKVSTHDQGKTLELIFYNREGL